MASLVCYAFLLCRTTNTRYLRPLGLSSLCLADIWNLTNQQNIIVFALQDAFLSRFTASMARYGVYGCAKMCAGGSLSFELESR
jgi:hypothetical protein